MREPTREGERGMGVDLSVLWEGIRGSSRFKGQYNFLEKTSRHQLIVKGLED